MIIVCSKLETLSLAHAQDPRLAAVFASLRTLCSPMAGTHLLLTLGDDLVYVVQPSRVNIE